VVGIAVIAESGAQSPRPDQALAEDRAGYYDLEMELADAVFTLRERGLDPFELRDQLVELKTLNKGKRLIIRPLGTASGGSVRSLDVR